VLRRRSRIVPSTIPRRSLTFLATIRVVAVSLVLALAAGCAALPDLGERATSHALEDTLGTSLGRAIAPHAAAHPGLTGVHAMRDGREAFAARVLLAKSAERSLDVQYYIWHADTSGKLLAHALWQAAERGVRVRMLLDDANTSGHDPFLATLDAHPNIEVRLFNKTFIADNQAAVVGGRNIGDEYLGAVVAVEFEDLDVIAAGAVVADVSASFDAYWSSASAYPVAALIPPAPADSSREAAAAWAALESSEAAKAYIEAVRDTVPMRAMLDGAGLVEWMPARLIADDPAKVLHPPGKLQMLPHLQASLGTPQEELLLVSPYFVPTRQGTDALLAIAARGVRVSVLTNSLASTDVTPTYAGYARYRRDLLRGGVRLYELKPSAVAAPRDPSERRKFGGSSGASLHAKTFAVDRQRVFVGSFNLDPRSASLNTEAGLLLESRALAGRLSDVFAHDLGDAAYEVRLLGDGNELVWIERGPGGEVRHTSSPGVGPMRRAWAGFLGWLPIEWLL
jgi:putative cardiolipin synthase